MANQSRIDARRTLQDAQADVIADTGNVNDGLLKRAGMKQDDIGHFRLQQFEAGELAKFKAHTNGD